MTVNSDTSPAEAGKTIPVITREPRRPHRARRVILIALGASALLGLGSAIGASGSSKPAPAPTVTAFAPAVRVTVTAPAPSVTRTAHVTVTQTAVVPPPALTVARYSGTSDWNSPQFTVSGGPLTVRYSYSGNQDSNFIAGVTDGNLDDLSIANTIGTAGGAATTLYPNGAGTYHLEITATGFWSVTITEAG